MPLSPSTTSTASIAALSVPEVFIYSSNIGAAKMALDMGVDRHRAFLKKLGLMSRVPTEIGDSAAPIIPRIGRSSTP